MLYRRLVTAQNQLAANVVAAAAATGYTVGSTDGWPPLRGSITSADSPEDAPNCHHHDQHTGEQQFVC